MSKKKIKVGFDLDGVVINKPLFVPQFVIDLLVRGKKDHQLSYRYPSTNFEKEIRILSHNPIFRPPIKENIKLIQKLFKSNKYELYVVSSRYSFLENRTKEWFRFYENGKFFRKIYINTKNEQPHIYKEKMIKKLRLDIFIDDDAHLVNYLKENLAGVKIFHVNEGDFRSGFIV